MNDIDKGDIIIQHKSAYEYVEVLIEYCKQNGFDEYAPTLNDLEISIQSELEECCRPDNQGA